MSTTRRAFVRGLAVSSAVVAVAPGWAAAADAAVATEFAHAPALTHAGPTAVVSFYMDQPWLDVSGRALAYLPPAGMRSAQPLAELSEAAFQYCFCGA
jgi:hypothetical protein